MNVYPIFKNFIDKNKVFEDFLCPSTNEICSIPLIDPYGKNYDQVNIYKFISDNKYLDDQKFTAPFTNSWICKNDLVVNTQYCRDLIKKCEEVYANVIKYGEDNEIKYGVDAVKTHTQNLMECIRRQMVTQLYWEYDDLVRKKEMTEDQRAAYIKASTKQWDFRDPV